MPSRNSNLGSMMPAAHTVQKVNDKSILLFATLALGHDRWHDGHLSEILLALLVPRRESSTSCRRSAPSAFLPTPGPSFGQRNGVGAFGMPTNVTSLGGASRCSGKANVFAGRFALAGPSLAEYGCYSAGHSAPRTAKSLSLPPQSNEHYSDSGGVSGVAAMQIKSGMSLVVARRKKFNSAR